MKDDRPVGLREAADEAFHELHVRYRHDGAFPTCDRPMCRKRRAALAATGDSGGPLDVERGCSMHPGLDAPGCDACWRVNHHRHDARYVGCAGCLVLAARLREPEGADHDR